MCNMSCLLVVSRRHIAELCTPAVVSAPLVFPWRTSSARASAHMPCDTVALLLCCAQVGDDCIKAHKLILTTQCDYFKKMLEPDVFAEGSTNSVQVSWCVDVGGSVVRCRDAGTIRGKRQIAVAHHSGWSTSATPAYCSMS